jgi:CIC family chloride channel protein
MVRSTDTQPDDAAHSVSGNTPGRTPDDMPGLSGLTGQSGKAAITNSPLALLLRYFRFGRDILRSYRQISHVRWLLIGIGVGVLSGLGAVLFYLAVEGGKHLFLTVLAGLSLPAPSGEALFHAAGHGGRQASDAASVMAHARPWVIPALTTGVGLLTGWLVQRFIPDTTESGTDGTDSMIKAFHRQEGNIRPKVPLIKTLTAILTISTGGSAGREGPISQAGAGIGCWLADRLGLTVKERRILLLAGAAGGLGAIFRAPLGGALTAVEVIYKEDFEAEALLPAVLSSVVAYSLFTLFYGTEPILGLPTFRFQNAWELAFYALLAVACSAAGWFYVRSFYFMKYSVFARIRDKVGIMWTTALGGLCMGLLGIVFPQVLSDGYGWLEMAVLGQVPALLMLAIILGKTLATSLTIGSGMSGGMFAPAMFVGGLSGGIVGQLGHKWFPDIVTQPGGYVLVGMAAFFAGIANAPIGPLIMVTELTRGYGLLAPLMLASALCLVLCRKVSLYEYQVDNKFESPAHLEDLTINVLENLRVQDHYRPSRVTVLEEAVTLKALTDIIANTNETYFPVRGKDGSIVGILSVQDVRKLLFERELFDLIVVGELARKPATLSPQDDLYTALLKFVDTDYGQIPVIDPGDPTEVLGLVNREDVFRAYSKTIRDIKGGKASGRDS